MSSSIARHTPGVLSRTGSGRVARQVGREVDQVAGRAVVHAAEVEAGAYVTHVAMTYAELLTNQELQAAAMYPERAYRFQAIAEGFTALAVNEIRKMAFE